MTKNRNYKQTCTCYVWDRATTAVRYMLMYNKQIVSDYVWVARRGEAACYTLMT